MRARALLALLSAFLVPACDDGGGRRSASDAPTPSSPAGGGAPAAPSGSTLSATLGGGQAGTPSSGRGRASVFLPNDGTMIEYTLEVRGLTSPGAARLRLGELGREGPILFELPAAEGRLFPEDLRPAEDVRNFPEALAALRTGRVHIGVSTEAYPKGEIRGQIGPATLKARFRGDAGYALLSLNGRQDEIAFELRAAGLSGPPIGAWIQIGRDGPPILEFAPGPFESPLRGTLGAEALRPRPREEVLAFEDAVDVLLRGDGVVVVRTTALPEGELFAWATPYQD